MTDEFTVERLRRLGESLKATGNGNGNELLKYAEAWEAERNILTNEILLLRLLVRDTHLRETLDDVASNCRVSESGGTDGAT